VNRTREKKPPEAPEKPVEATREQNFGKNLEDNFEDNVEENPQGTSKLNRVKMPKARRRPPAARAQVRHLARDSVTERVEVDPARARRGLLPWRRPNHRVTVQVRSPALWCVEALVRLGKRLLVLGKIGVAAAMLTGTVYGARWVIAHVVASPRFAVRDIQVSSTVHIPGEDVAKLAGVVVGDALLAIDTDAVASRLARHPWVAAARVRRELPSTFVIEVAERHAAALAIIGGLYLLDQDGHPFKRATLDETPGLVVLTGVSRKEYAGLREASEAAMREALALLAEYQHPDTLAAVRTSRGLEPGRPALSEIHIDPRKGYTLVLYEGGGQIHVGRGDFAGKLARFDEIVAELRAASTAAAPAAGPGHPVTGLASLRVVHLEGEATDRVPILFSSEDGPGTGG
jgi:cell division septal protein FtsQ